MNSFVAYYDLKQAPITYDFCHFIVGASALATLQRQETFDLVILADSWRNLTPRELSYTIADRKWRLWNLIMEIIQVIPNLGDVSLVTKPPRDVALSTFPHKYHPQLNPGIPYQWPMVKKLMDHGADVRLMQPSANALGVIDKVFGGEKNLVSITLRKAGHDPIRDSRLDDWYEFYKILKAKGFRPIIVPDQDDTLSERVIQKKYDWEVFEASTMSCDIRLALYMRSRMNYVTSNGLIGLLMYSKAPFCFYSVVVEGSHVATVDFHKQQGLEEGGKYPWLDNNQHLFWKSDKIEHLKESLPLFTLAP